MQHDPEAHEIMIRTADGKVQTFKVAANFAEASTLIKDKDYRFTIVNDQVTKAKPPK